MPTRYAQSRTIDTTLIVNVPYGGRSSRDTGVWPKAEGFGLTGDDVRYAEYPVATGVFSREDATLRRPFDEFSGELKKWLEANRGAAVTIIQSRRGDDGLPLGAPDTYTGRISGVTGPEADITASERAELSVTCVLDVVAS